MKFYRIRHSINAKIMGKIPQVKEVLSVTNIKDTSIFIGKVYFSKINFIPQVANPVLYPKSYRTDLIEQIGQYSLKILISEKLKAILEKCRNNGMQFFQNPVFQNGIEYMDYWVLNMYNVNNEFIDYKKCKVILEKKAHDFEETYITNRVELDIESLEDFHIEITKAQVNLEALYIENLALVNVTEDFFILRRVEGGVGYFVSEKLKNEIEEAGCSGIEFQPSELSYNEWVVRDGPRDQVYGRSW